MLRTPIVLLLGLLSSLAAAQAPPPDADVGRLWSYEAPFATFAGGELVVERMGRHWHATFAGNEARVVVRDGALLAQFAPDVGAFRATLPEAGAAFAGWWLRPGATADPRYPGGATQPMASPMVLERDGRRRWHGTVRPLPTPFRLYLKFTRNEEGTKLAAFRDPDQNRNGGASRFRVDEQDGKLAFLVPNDQDGFDTAFAGARVPGSGAIRVRWPDLGRDLELQPTTAAQAIAFVPRPPGEPAYAYRQPDAIADGWPTARAADVGIDEAALVRAVRKIIDGDPAARQPSLVHSLLLARHGKLVLEEYFFGYTRDTPHDLRSAGKTFASVLLGAARLEGATLSPDTPVYAVMAPRGPFAHPDPRKASITLAHLLTHASGLACNDNDEASPGNEGTMQAQAVQPDWWKYTLDLPMAHDPGTRYAYCSANIDLAGGVLTQATGTWIPDLFDRHVARPLGFGEYHWNLSPTGEGYFGGGAWLRPRDLLKVGQAFLDGGQWQGHRIVDAAWIAESTRPRIAITPETTGYAEEDFGNYYGRGEDALAWHLGSLKVGEKSYPTFGASGNGGQLLVVVPAIDVVMVFTGGNYRQGGIWSQWPNRIVGEALAEGFDEQ